MLKPRRRNDVAHHPARLRDHRIASHFEAYCDSAYPNEAFETSSTGIGRKHRLAMRAER